MSVLNGGLLGSSGGGGGGGISNIVEDTSPELGANLDVLGFGVVSSVGDIDLTPASGSDVVVNLPASTITIEELGGVPTITGTGGYTNINNTSGARLQRAGSTVIEAGNNIVLFKQVLPNTVVNLGASSNPWDDFWLNGQIGIKASSDPTGATDVAHIYAKDVTASSEIFVRDEGGTVTQISEHSRLAPASMYDDEDEIIDRMGFEIQYFQGFVRFTNKTRIGLLTAMTDAEKTLLTAEQRQCVYQESFSAYNTRTGENLVQLDWDVEQTKLQTAYDLRVADGDVPAKDIKKAKPTWLV